MVIIGGFPLDVALTEEPTYDSEVTQFNIESGAEPADHIINHNPKIKISGIVTDTPLAEMLALRRPVAGPSLPTDAAVETKFTDQADAHILNLRSRKEPFRLETSLRVFESCVITSYTPKRKGDSLEVEIEMEQLRIVSIERVEVAQPQHGKQTVFRRNVEELKDVRGKSLVAVTNTREKDPNKRTTYFHQDGTPVSREELAAANHRTDAVAIEYKPDGKGGFKAVPIDNNDFQPYTPKPRRAWAAGDELDRDLTEQQAVQRSVNAARNKTRGF